jgi:hypothetical protein
MLCQTKPNTTEKRTKTMQIKVEKMKRLSPKTDSQRDNWRFVNKQKTVKRKLARKAKQFAQAS